MKPTKDSFHQFCLRQVMRLSQIPQFPYHEEGVAELVSYVERKADGNRARVEQLIDAFVDGEKSPCVADLSRMWIELFPVTDQSVCELCADTPGWCLVERTKQVRLDETTVVTRAYTAVERCTHPKNPGRAPIPAAPAAAAIDETRTGELRRPEQSAALLPWAKGGAA